MQYHFILNDVSGKKNLTIFIGGVPTPVDDTHPAFEQILEAVRSGETLKVIRDLLDTDKRVRKQLARFGNVSVEDGVVKYKGEAVHGLLADRMLQMLEDGFDVRPWALFLENLQQNPAKHAVDELYLWLERSNMPITERGNFLAYKKVQDDYTSYHRNADGTEFRNDIGTFVSMPRNKVDDNRNRTCSSGLHFCSWDYLPSYMGNRGRVVLVEVNPAHVVSIPSDYNNAKGRAEGYLIVGEIPEDQAKHAFPGLSYVGYDDSEYILHKQEGDIDYSAIEDGWFVDDFDDLEDEERHSDAYEMGYNNGFDDGYNDYEFENSAFYSGAHGYEKSYYYGYADGFYAGESAREEDYVDAIEDLDNPWSPWHWTEKGVADAINRGDLTMVEFVSEYYPTQDNVLEVVDRLRMDY